MFCSPVMEGNNVTEINDKQFDNFLGAKIQFENYVMYGKQEDILQIQSFPYRY